MPVLTTYYEVLLDRYFFDFIFSALIFITEKKNRECNVSLRLLHKTMKKLNSKLDNDTTSLF